MPKSARAVLGVLRSLLVMPDPRTNNMPVPSLAKLLSKRWAYGTVQRAVYRLATTGLVYCLRRGGRTIRVRTRAGGYVRLWRAAEKS